MEMHCVDQLLLIAMVEYFELLHPNNVSAVITDHQ